MTDGAAEIGFARRDGVTRLAHLYQTDPLRVLFPLPEAGDPIQAAIVTTSGGLVAGDRIDLAVRVEPGASAHVTASAAEKIYRSPRSGNGGATTAIRQSLTAGGGAALEFLPPETILFDGAWLQRETVVELGPGAAFLGGDIVVFGRRARGERFTHGFLREVWEVRREGCAGVGRRAASRRRHRRDRRRSRLLRRRGGFRDLDPGAGRARSAEISSTLPARCRPPRRKGSGPASPPSAGLLVARWLAADAALLRRAYADLACHWRAEALGLPPRLPRIWHV